MSLCHYFLFGSAVALSLAANPALANESLVSAGYSHTTGGVAVVSNIHSSSQNPASLPSLIREDENMRFGYFSNLGAYLEVGKVENMDDVVEDLTDDIDAVNHLPDSGLATRPRLQRRYPNATKTKAGYYSAIAKKVNNITLGKLERGGKIKGGAMLNAPLTPYLFRSDLANGTVSINMDVSTQFKGRVVTAPFQVETRFTNTGNGDKQIDFNPAAINPQTVQDVQDAVDAYRKGTKTLTDLTNKILSLKQKLGLDDQEIQTIKDIKNSGNTSITADTSLTTNSGVAFKAAAVARFSLGYSTSLTDLWQLDSQNGELTGGLRFNYYYAKLGRNFVSFTNDNNDDDLFDQASDNFSDYIEADSNIGLDLGVLWQNRHYQLGATMYNLNEPKFDYPDISDYVSGHSLEALKYQATQGKMAINDSVRLGRHTVVEGAIFTADRMFSLGAYYTLGKATNFVGDNYRNTGITAGIYTNSWWIPAIRLGYNSNLTGTKLDIIKFGLTLFGVFNLDMAASTDKTSYDGSSIPRYAAVSLGFSEKF